jgi:hypothetical protein
VTIKRNYRPELDVLRFIAFMIVFIVHRMDFIPIDPARHYWLYNLCLLGDLGVSVFFLLSAFLITELLFRESDGTGTIQLKAFYMRRILRIWPLYFFVFFGLVLLERFVHYAGAKDPTSWLAFTFFAGNWWICLHGWVPAYPVNPLWSISVEEQLYIAVPIIALVGRRLGVKAISLFPCRRRLHSSHPLRYASYRGLQQPMDQQLRPVSVFRRRNLALDLSQRPRPAVAPGSAPFRHAHRHRLLAGRLPGVWSPGLHPAFSGPASSPRLGTRPDRNRTSVPQYAWLPFQILAVTDHLPGENLLRPLSLPRTRVFSDLLSRQSVAHPPQPVTASR